MSKSYYKNTCTEIDLMCTEVVMYRKCPPLCTEIVMYRKRPNPRDAFGLMTWVGPRNQVLDAGPDPPMESGNFEGARGVQL